MTKFRDNSAEDYSVAKKVYYTILVCSFIWLLMIFLAPIFSEKGGLSGNISSAFYMFFSTVCHQQDERSFHIFEHKLGVCSRCVWIYGGFFLGTAVYPLKYKINNFIPPAVYFLGIPVLLLLLDVIFDNTGIIRNTFLSRSVTGLLVGFALSFYLIPGFVKFFYEVNSFLRNKVSI